ncbi:MAG: histidine kinase [Aestuariibacter sp.]|nr:histidine kinase [Aestuariibacter sp.]
MKNETNSSWSNHFAVLRDKQTYLNIIYLLLAFPLGIAYFVISITGLSVGVGLLIIWIGLFVLLALFASWWGLAALERLLAVHLLGEEIAPMSTPITAKGTVWERTKAHFSNPLTWKSAAYLLLKFPLGIASFVGVITAVSLSAALIFAPLIYQTGNISIFAWQINTFGEAILATGIGLLITPSIFKLLNKVAELSGQFVRFMLSNGEPVIKEKSPEDLLKVA